MPLPQTCQLPRLQQDLRAGSISEDIGNFPSELCRRRILMFAEVARLVPPGQGCAAQGDNTHSERAPYLDTVGPPYEHR